MAARNFGRIPSILKQEGLVSVPGYQEFMLPLLRIASDGGEHKVTDAMDTIAVEMNISADDQEALLPSGVQTRFYNRITWALTYLTKSRLAERTGRGRFRITDRGLEILKQNPPRIDNHFLEQFSEYKEFKTKRAAKAAETRAGEDAPVTDDPEITPEERLVPATETYVVKKVDGDFFEAMR